MKSMRNVDKLARFVSLLVLVLALGTITYNAEAHIGIVLSGNGTATIDGVMSPGEWDLAKHVDFSVNVGDGMTTPATFFAMNDADNLYLALRVQIPTVNALFTSFDVEFDNDHDGFWIDEGDDVFVLNPPNYLSDDFRTYLPPCPPNALCGLLDTDFGGTNDGGGMVVTAGEFIVYEVYRPLDSADDAHDFSLQAGDIVGWNLSLRLFVDSGIVDTSFPTPGSAQGLYGDIIILPSADLSVTITDSIDPLLWGQNLTYTLTVTNNGPSPATGVMLTDTLPEDLIFVSASSSKGSCDGTLTVTCDLGNLANTESATITLVVTPTKDGTITNLVSVTGNQPDHISSNNTDTESTTVVRPVDLAVTKTASAEPATVGTLLTYTVTVTNNGPSAASGVALTDTLPEDVTFVSVSSSRGSCDGTLTVTCGLGDLANTESATITLVVTPTKAGTITNLATVTGNEDDPVLSNNTDTESTAVVQLADLAVTKTAFPDPVTLGNPLTYVITVTNNGPSPDTGVMLTDTLPEDVTFVSATPSQGNCDGTSVITCSIGILVDEAQASVTIIIVPTVTGTINNSASVWGDGIDPDPINDTAATISTATLDATGTITPDSGGTVTGGDGVSVQFPPGAVTETLTVTYTSEVMPSQSLPNGTMVLRSFSLEAFTSAGQPVPQFNRAVTITIDYTDADLTARGILENTLNVTFWNGSVWVNLLPCDGCGVDTFNNRLTIVLDHFTEFAVSGSGEHRLFLPLLMK